MIRLTFYGGVRNVTGSMHLVEFNGYRLLLDCGLYQGRREETYRRNLRFPFKSKNIDALIISHAHIDHLGNVPNLVKDGFNGDVHCTPATADLAGIMLLDSARVQERDAQYVSKVRKRHGEPPVEPLYHIEDVEPALRLFISHHYNRWFNLNVEVKVIFRDAGHILGSAITVLNISDGERILSLCYTGDLGKKNSPIVRDPYIVQDADILIIESTYGERLHGDFEKAVERLADVINETVKSGGKIIIPSFALERTQDLVYNLHKLRLQGSIPDIPVYVDSPLAIDATDIFRLHPECLDAETNMMQQEVEDPFGFRHLHYIRSVEDSKKLNKGEGPMIIIACSGMAENGRILHHLKNNISDVRNTVMIVGYQAKDTLGWKLANKWEVVRIFGEEYTRKCRIEVFDEFSAHADRDQLINWVVGNKGRWQRIFIVHGEEKASESLAQALRDAGLSNITVPASGQSFII